MEKEYKIKNVKETIVYCERITEEIIEELSEEQSIRYFIWDEITRNMGKLFSESLLPVIEEVFGKEYSRNVSIEFLTKKYVVDKNRSNSVNAMHSVCADLVMRIAFEHGLKKCKKHKKERTTLLEMPRSVILYLIHTGNTPDFESMEILFPNGKVCDYQVPVLKVQKYI